MDIEGSECSYEVSHRWHHCIQPMGEILSISSPLVACWCNLMYDLLCQSSFCTIAWSPLPSCKNILKLSCKTFMFRIILIYNQMNFKRFSTISSLFSSMRTFILWTKSLASKNGFPYGPELSQTGT